MRTGPKKLKADLIKLVGYLWHDEKMHYMGLPSRNHIYATIQGLQKQFVINRIYKARGRSW